MYCENILNGERHFLWLSDAVITTWLTRSVSTGSHNVGKQPTETQVIDDPLSLQFLNLFSLGYSFSINLPKSGVVKLLHPLNKIGKLEELRK